jgi:catechol 2,3-dioxygenase-like lactoylglutathione lyase family enzyme
MTPTLHHTGLTVGDLDRSLRFWSDGLGMRVVMRQDRQGGYLEAIVREEGAHVRQAQLELTEGGPRVELFEYLEPRGERLDARPRDIGFAHVAVLCDDVDALVDRLVEYGGQPFGPVVEVDAGVNRGARAVYLHDPDGHVLELFSAAPKAPSGE